VAYTIYSNYRKAIWRGYGVDGHSFDEDIVASDFFFHIVLFGVAWWIGGPTLI
jgi:hypothetical protein